jgi:predicted SAM-dependent methyltransferase
MIPTTARVCTISALLAVALPFTHGQNDEPFFCADIRKVSADAAAKRILDRPLNIYLGSSGLKLTGFIDYSHDLFDITSSGDYAKWLCLESVDAFLTEHTFEHIETAHHRHAFQLMSKYLKPGGFIRTAVPLYPKHHVRHHIDIEYGHVAFHTKQSLISMLRGIGFVNITALEYLDEDTQSLCTTTYDACKGRVMRSLKHDKRNINLLNSIWPSLNKSSYNELGDNCIPLKRVGAASLIVDAYKPESL